MKYHSQGKQLTLDAFRSSLDNLPKNNRWVRLGDRLPWDKIEKAYNANLKNKNSGGNKPARIVVGALIIKYKLKLSDGETIRTISENPFMQYMLGIEELSFEPVFSPSLFPIIRSRLGSQDTSQFVRKVLAMGRKKRKKKVATIKDEVK